MASNVENLDTGKDAGDWFDEPIPADSDLWDYLQERVDQMPVGVEPLTDAERKVISSVVGQLNWAARQGRYDLAYVASLVQQLAGRGRPEALKWLNLGVKRAQEPLNFKVRNFGCPLSEMVLISVSDAAYGAIHGAWRAQPRREPGDDRSSSCPPESSTCVHLGGQQHEDPPGRQVLNVG